MDELDLKGRYGQMEPISKMPFLGSFLGCGFQFSATYEHDDEIASFLTNHSFCLLTVPILHLGAYRIVETQEGSVVIGRELLSTNARTWNLCSPIVIVLLALSIWYWQYRSTDSFKAQRRLAQAAQLLEEKNYSESIQAYREVANGKTKYKTDAIQAVERLIKDSLNDAPTEKVAACLDILVEMVQLRELEEETLTPLDHGLRLAEMRLAKEPDAALEILDAVSALGEQDERFVKMRLPLLERLAKQKPDDVEVAVQLAMLYQMQGEWDKCETLLVPHKDKLGDGEGARILGQVYARSGKFDEGYPLLNGYVESRLKQMHRAQKSYESLRKKLIDTALHKLRNDQGPAQLQRKIRAASEKLRTELVNDFIQETLRDNRELGTAQLEVMKYARVVSVATQLGMVVLRRGTRLRDPQARTKEMKKAEKIFLSVRGLASQSSQYQLSLGEVLYWLERPKEAQVLFDTFLSRQKRSHPALMAVAGLLRNLGSSSEAGKLAEEAYSKGSSDAEKHSSATLRALTTNDLDDTIKWLQRCNQANLDTKALLAKNRAQRSMISGDLKSAETDFRLAISIYEKQVDSTASFNNAALAYSQLFTVTGDVTMLDKRLTLLERAVTLAPSDGIVLSNVATATTSAAYRNVIGKSLDLGAIKSSGSNDLLQFLFDDNAGRERIIAKVKKNRLMQKAVDFLEQSRLIAPKRIDSYEHLATLAFFVGDLEGLKSLILRAQKSQPGQDRAVIWKNYLSGKNDQEITKGLQSSLKEQAQVVKSLRGKSSSKRSFAAAACQLVSTMIRARQYGQSPTTDEIVTLAKEAYQTAPSVATRNHLVWSLLIRGSATEAKRSAALRKILSANDKRLSRTQFIVFLMSRDAKLRAKLIKNADIRRSQELTLVVAKKDPQSFSYWDWALLRLAFPEDAKRMRGAIEKNDLNALNDQLNELLAPYRPLQHQIRNYHRAEFKNDKSAREKALAKIRERLPSLR